jgi:hypothetical protein
LSSMRLPGLSSAAPIPERGAARSGFSDNSSRSNRSKRYNRIADEAKRNRRFYYRIALVGGPMGLGNFRSLPRVILRSVATKNLVADSRPFVVAQGDIFLDRKSRAHLACRWFSFFKSHITIYDIRGEGVLHGLLQRSARAPCGIG